MFGLRSLIALCLLTLYTICCPVSCNIGSRIKHTFKDVTGEAVGISKREFDNVKKGLEYIIKELKDVKIESRYCSCEQTKCTCCATVEISKVGLNDEFCFEVGYLKENYGVEAEFRVDGKVVFSEEISAKNPPPICVRVPIKEIQEILDVCVKLSDLSIAQKSWGGCVSLTFDAVFIEIADIDLGCFNVGPFWQDWFCSYGSDQSGNPDHMCLSACLGKMTYFKKGKVYNESLLLDEQYEEKVLHKKQGCHYMKKKSTHHTIVDKKIEHFCLLGCDLSM